MLTDTSAVTFYISDALVSCIQISWVWDKYLLCYGKYSICIEILKAEYIQNISEKGIQLKQFVIVVKDWSHVLECRNFDSATKCFHSQNIEQHVPSPVIFVDLNWSYLSRTADTSSCCFSLNIFTARWRKILHFIWWKLIYIITYFSFSAFSHGGIIKIIYRAS